MKLFTGCLAASLVLLAAGAWMLRVRREPFSIAVLPLENLNQAPDTDYLANGLTDEIIRSAGLEPRDVNFRELVTV